MRLALISDVHGNSIALDAVLEDIERRGGADEHLFLGDHLAIGADPVGVLERITKRSRTCCVRGNTDRYLVTGERPTHTFGAATEDEKTAMRIEFANSFSWTQGYVTAAGWFDWLAALPFEIRLVLPNGSRLLGVHGTHRADDEKTLRAGASDAELTSSSVAPTPSSCAPVTRTSRSIGPSANGSRRHASSSCGSTTTTMRTRRTCAGSTTRRRTT